LAGSGRREEALREARWLQQSVVYREDAFEGPELAEARSQILAQAGEAKAALDEIERLLAGPSKLSVHTLRLDPRWDPIRDQPRFKALLEKYGSGAARRWTCRSDALWTTGPPSARPRVGPLVAIRDSVGATRGQPRGAATGTRSFVDRGDAALCSAHR